MKTIIFDERNYAWVDHDARNLLFVQCRAHYIEDLFKVRGYIYLNQICEIFGIGWDPSDENVCYTILDNMPKFEFEHVEDKKILIHIS